jgi:hypothetical protein
MCAMMQKLRMSLGSIQNLRWHRWVTAASSRPFGPSEPALLKLASVTQIRGSGQLSQPGCCSNSVLLVAGATLEHYPAG